MFPKIKTYRCILNCISNADIPILQEIFDDEATKYYLRELNELVVSKDGIRQFLDSFSCYVNRNEGILWGIYLNSKLVGFIAIMDMPDNPTLFYAMHSDYRLQGIMKECIIEATNFISKQTYCNFLQTEVYKDNDISINILQSADFKIIDFNDNKVFLKIEFR